jgi:uncharacterized RDD family membrane protein YckC
VNEALLVPDDSYTLRIRLPEGVTFALPLGGPVSRCLAFLMDVFVVSMIVSLLQQLASSVRSIYEDFGAGLLVLAYFGVWTLYGMLCEYYWHGQTIGKWLLGLRVMDSKGLELQFYQVAVRNLVRTVDLFPAVGLLGGLIMLCNRRLQRLGDLAAGTIVVRTSHSAPPNVDALVRGRYNSFLAHQVLCARLRQRVPAEIAGIAADALMRRDVLDDRDRLMVFDDIAAYFRSLVEFPADQTDQLTSEQYVRNVVEILYSTARKA